VVVSIFTIELFQIVWTSITIAFYSVILSGFFGILIAFIIDNTHGIVNKTGRAILNSLMAIPTVVIGLLVYAAISRSGIFGEFSILYSPLAIIIGQTVLVIPVISSVLLSGFSGVDMRLSETLKTLGANGFSYIIAYLYETKVIIATALLNGFARVVGEVGISMMLGGNIRYYTRTMTTSIALETSKGDFKTSLSLALILICIALTINFLVHFLIHDKKEIGTL